MTVNMTLLMDGGMAKINVNLDSNYIGQFEIVTSRPFTIGRSPKCDLHLANPAVSGLHAVITYENDSYIITDRKSSNGTIINNKLYDKKRLEDGDLIQVSKYRITFWNSVTSGLDNYEAEVILDDAEKAIAEKKHQEKMAEKNNADTYQRDSSDDLEFKLL